MRFWLDMGVDGLRLDAIPYLIEREGTNCENLAESHAVIKQIRSELDAAVPRQDAAGRGEPVAGRRPRVLRRGDGDECHMAFHFPLMPRIYMALRQEDRHPIVEIMRQTPEIPPDCQWAIFLRNHDELTLEMVTDEERDYMNREYAADPRMRINLGIRRRLAPLIQQQQAPHRAAQQPAPLVPGNPGDLLRRRDRHGRQHLPRRPQRRAHPDAVERRPQRRLLAGRLRPALRPPRSWTRSTATTRSTSKPSSASPRHCCSGCGGSSRCGSGTRPSAAARSSSSSPRTARSSPTSAGSRMS